MDDWMTRIWTDLTARLTGLFAFRFVLQPVMGLFFAWRDGVHDAKTGRPPYFWALFSQPDERTRLVQEGLRKIGRVIVLGIVMEVLYQLIVLRWIYPLELVIMVVGLAVLPYLLLRGPINRIARHWLRPKRVEVL
jgi:hypothetical protein